MSIDETWGQLVSLTDFESAPLLLTTDKFTIGRAPDCDFSLLENKLVSGHHCHLERAGDGTVTLHDSSTNGTLLNLTYKISKGKSKVLEHGDEFYIVYKKNNEAANVGYIYQSMAELLQEEGTQEYSAPDLMDSTLQDVDVNYITPETHVKKRQSEDYPISNETVAVKRKKFDHVTDIKSNTDKAYSSKLETNFEDHIVKMSDTGTSEKDNVLQKQAEADTKSGHKEMTFDTIDDEKEACHKDTKCGETGQSETAQSKGMTPRDDIEENLQCTICQEIMHDCISLQPCLHSFCAGCYSDWMKRSQECPSCRKKVKRVNKNHIVNNLIEAYLKEHPEKKRPEGDIKELNEKNKITKDMLYPKKSLVEEDSSDYSNTDDDDSDIDNAALPSTRLFDAPVRNIAPVPAPAFAPVLFGFGTPLFGTQIAKTVCRQCPDYKDPLLNQELLKGIKTALTTVKNLVTGGEDTATVSEEVSAAGTAKGGATEPEASTSGEDSKPSSKPDVKVICTAPTHVCPANQNHVLCQCCLQPMPDFRAVGVFGDPAAKIYQQCSLCYRAFCHAYWGCRKADCLGCLDKFKDMNFGRKALIGLILDNQYESDIFRDYIDSQTMSVRDVLQHCCKQMDAGLFTVTAQGTAGFTTDSPVCYTCGMAQFKQLALQYRKTIKKEQLSEEARNRPDCYWGSKCRTQKNKPHHAKNFNHVCDQTRQF